MEFYILTAESVPHRQIIVVVIVPKILFEFVNKIDVEELRTLGIEWVLWRYLQHLDEFWSVIAFATVFGIFW